MSDIARIMFSTNKVFYANLLRAALDEVSANYAITTVCVGDALKGLGDHWNGNFFRYDISVTPETLSKLSDSVAYKIHECVIDGHLTMFAYNKL